MDERMVGKMYENKCIKSTEKSTKGYTDYKLLQRKAQPYKPVQYTLNEPNTIYTGDVAQFKKVMENQSLMNLINIKPLQREVNPDEEEEPVQMKRENNTGMPDQLKSGIESISGIDISNVRVHFNSDKPAEVGALAYTQGTDIHVAAGQERHLAHEAWHVVQQAQGRVQPTMQLRDVAVNDDPGLEYEADVMGERAMSIQPD